MSFPFIRQQNLMDCGPACLQMICSYHGKDTDIEDVRKFTEAGKEGVNMLGLSMAAEKLGLRSMAAQATFKELKKDIQLPAILHWEQKHFVVLFRVKRNRCHIADPARGIIQLPAAECIRKWAAVSAEDHPSGFVLTLEPTPAFYEQALDPERTIRHPGSLTRFIPYLKPHRKLILQLLCGMLLGSMLQLVFPFLTQSIVDTGINSGDLSLVFIILLAQLALLAGRMTVEFIRSWILYHISTRISIGIITDFLCKLLRLPISYFDSRRTGDIMQRLNDHNRIQGFLTGTSLSTLFSFFNIALFSVILGMYDIKIFLVFSIASVIYLCWIHIFMHKRKLFEYRRFDISAAEQNKTIELIQGMQEIKLYGCENKKRWELERVKGRGFKLGQQGIRLNQWQRTGAFMINEGKNIFITFLSAQLVIQGKLTLGGMLSVQYIIGQLNAPIEQLVGFMQNWQLARISMDRLNEVHALPSEDANAETTHSIQPTSGAIRLHDVSFTYPGAGNEPVFEHLNITFPENKVTAIVGASGSGKTTLLKLLLKIYEPQCGTITIGDQELQHIPHRNWRARIGTVMQDSFIFSDSIAGNIAVGDEMIDQEKMYYAARIANVDDFTRLLPAGYKTRIGAEGKMLSSGQRQRILIARAIYKDPDYLFFDEATNTLDAGNESMIVQHMETFFQTRTVIIIAHRLSTVRHADQIIVLDNGRVQERGDHDSLVLAKGSYYELIKDQLELAD